MVSRDSIAPLRKRLGASLFGASGDVVKHGSATTRYHGFSLGAEDEAGEVYVYFNGAVSGSENRVTVTNESPWVGDVAGPIRVVPIENVDTAHRHKLDLYAWVDSVPIVPGARAIARSTQSTLTLDSNTLTTNHEVFARNRRRQKLTVRRSNTVATGGAITLTVQLYGLDFIDGVEQAHLAMTATLSSSDDNVPKTYHVDGAYDAYRAVYTVDNVASSSCDVAGRLEAFD